MIESRMYVPIKRILMLDTQHSNRRCLVLTTRYNLNSSAEALHELKLIIPREVPQVYGACQYIVLLM